MSAVPPDSLSKKEREAMEVLYRLGRATAAEVRAELPHDPSYSAVRSLLGVLVEKNLARAGKAAGARHHVYEPAMPLRRARKSALRRLLNTFFEDSPAALVASLLDPAERRVPEDEIARIQQMIDAQRAARKGRSR